MERAIGRTLKPTQASGIPLAFYFAAAFLVVAPLSLAIDLEASGTLKYVRVGICMLGVLLAVAAGAIKRLGSASGALMAFAVFYSIAPAWSQYPLNGVIYRTVFLSTLFLGLFVGASCRSPEQLRKGLRLLGAVAAVASSIVFYQYRTSPSEMTQVGRLAAYGINANAIGMTAAGYSLITVFLAVNEKGFWRILGIGGSGVLLLVLIATGSRASMAMALVGATIQFVPWMKRPGRIIMIAIPLAIVLLAFSGDIDPTALARITGGGNTRAGMWQAGVRLFLKSPVIGLGWVSSGRSTGNLQNMYLQILAETGIIGGVLFVAAAAGVARVIAQARPKGSDERRHAFYFALGIVIALAIHGIAESALILGSTVNTMLFGLAVGMLRTLSEAEASTYSLRRSFPEGFSLTSGLTYPAPFDAPPARYPQH